MQQFVDEFVCYLWVSILTFYDSVDFLMRKIGKFWFHIIFCKIVGKYPTDCGKDGIRCCAYYTFQ